MNWYLCVLGPWEDTGLVWMAGHIPAFPAFGLWAPSPNTHSYFSTSLCGLLACVVFDSTLREMLQISDGTYRSSRVEVRKGVHVFPSVVAQNSDLGRTKELKCLPNHFASCSGIKKGQAINYVQKEDFSRMDLVYLIVKKRSCLLFFYSHVNWFCRVEVGLSPFVFYGFVISALEKRSS